MEHIFHIYYIKGTVALSLMKNGAQTDYYAPVAAQGSVTIREGEKVHTQLTG